MDAEQFIEQQIAQENESFAKQQEQEAAKMAELENAYALEIAKKQEQKAKENAAREAREKRDAQGQHSTPRMTTKEFIERRVQDFRETIGDAETIEVPEIDTPPSIYHTIHGKTWLANQMGLNDSKQAQFVNDFLLHSMDIESIEDSQKGFDASLNKLMKRVGLNEAHKPEYIVNKLYTYLTGRNKYADDDIVISIMRNKTRHRYSGR